MADQDTQPEQKTSYYERNRERVKENAKAYYWKNRDKYLEYNRQYYIQNKQELIAKHKTYRHQVGYVAPKRTRPPRPPKAPKAPKEPKVAKTPALRPAPQITEPMYQPPPSILIQMPPPGAVFVCRFD